MTVREMIDLLEDAPDDAKVWVGLSLQGKVEADGVKIPDSDDPEWVLIWGDDRGT